MNENNEWTAEAQAADKRYELYRRSGMAKVRMHGKLPPGELARRESLAASVRRANHCRLGGF